MPFYGREKEIKIIDNLLTDDSYKGCIVYGRRRLGKTELLKYCLLGKDMPCLYFQCLQDSERGNVLAFTKVIEKTFGLSHLSFDSFADAIEFVFELSIKNKLSLVIDEYPYIRKLISGLDSKLQYIIDSYSSKSKLKLFLSGSSIAIMEDVMSENNPLYMRFHSSILLKEMDYYDSSLFYPSFANEDKVRLYAAFGGVPFYNMQIDSRLSVKENIIRLLSGSFSHLMDDITVNLKEELAKVNSACQVFSAIAQGAFHYKDILDKSHINSSASLSDILEKLLKMDLIEYIAPINDYKNKMKSGYRIADSTMKFYYHYIYNNQSTKAILDDDTFYDLFIKDDFETQFVPICFEKVAKQYLINQNKRGLLKPLLLDIGTYWYDCPEEKRNGQFDIVGRCKEGYIFYEVKFTNKPIDDYLIEEEIKQVKKTSLKPISYGFVSKSNYSLDSLYPYQLIGIDDIYKKQ